MKKKNTCSWCGTAIDEKFKGFPVVECNRCAEMRSFIWSFPELAAAMLGAKTVLVNHRTDGKRETTGIFNKVISRITGYSFPKKKASNK